MCTSSRNPWRQNQNAKIVISVRQRISFTLSLSVEFLFNKPIELFIVVMAVYVGIVLLLISIYCDLATIGVLMILFDNQA